MEGNNWGDNANGTFTSNELTIRYSPLDQYAMGLRSTGEVPVFFFIKDPTGTTNTRSSSPAIGVTVTGIRQNVSISQITASEGPRPSGFTGVNPTTVWHQAFVLLVSAGTAPSSADLSKIETVRSSWVLYFANAVEGRGSISTNLGTVPPAAAVALNGASFRTDDTVGYQATLTPGSAPTQVDIYLGALLPDGATFVSLVPSPGGAIALAFGPVPVPFSTNTALAPHVVPFLYSFAWSDPVGTYYTYAGIVVARTDPLQPANQLSLAVQAFQFTP
jgi:hypothetical protein